jgi:hypothetical protein
MRPFSVCNGSATWGRYDGSSVRRVLGELDRKPATVLPNAFVILSFSQRQPAIIEEDHNPKAFFKNRLSQ